MIFEANCRLVKHLYDIIGIRRQQLFEDSLNDCLEVEQSGERNRFKELVKLKLFQCFNKRGVQKKSFLVMKIVAMIIVVTLAVTINDYIQDVKVINLFWQSLNSLSGFDKALKNFSWYEGVFPAVMIKIIY